MRDFGSILNAVPLVPKHGGSLGGLVATLVAVLSWPMGLLIWLTVCPNSRAGPPHSE